VRRAALAALAAVVLGASCTGDRSAPGAGPAGKPRCEAHPGRGVEGFVLNRTREIEEPDHVAVRKEYRDRRGRLLVYLLGLSGEVGEGLPFLREVGLVTGQPARFLGRDGNWTIVWEEGFPCSQMAVVGNGFGREDFVRALVEADIIAPRSASQVLGEDLTEWVAVFHTASTPSRLDQDREILAELAPRNLVVGPVGCHRGLARALGIDERAYFSGVVAEGRAELDEVVRDARRSPVLAGEPLLFRGELEVLCAAD
jgi:hypothetical protein